ncbi:MAG: sensor histidine kinase [Lachnospiraceae bacterium]|nr:sensor histidine kinase [Lachnospiraceae bacterium]
MKFRSYIKDQVASVCIFFVAWAIMLIFFRAFRMGHEQIVIISVIFFLFEMLQLGLDFLRKKNFYEKLLFHSKNLNKKYLLPEMLEEPSFLEGKMVYEVLRASHKSMCEHVTMHRHAFSEFREYIELWVHEIKLPVAGLQLMVHNHPEISGKYDHQLQRIDEYIENVLYYARSENAEKDYLIKEVSLKRAVANTALKYRDDLLEQGISLKTEHLDKMVRTDGKWLEYMLGQILGNAVKYLSGEQEPEIIISAEEAERETTLYIRDNGIGISASDLPYIFEKSFTGENGRRYAKATGMGLYLVRNLCEKLGHRVNAASVQGEYTEISITFGEDEFYKKI